MATHDDRIHACLDGDLPMEALSEDERHRLEALKAALADAATAIRAAPVPDLAGRVMAALPQERPAAGAASEVALRPLARIVRALWSPVPIPIRPAYGLAGVAAVLLALLLLPPTVPRPAAPPIAAGAAGGSRMYVQFRIEVPGASQVAVAGTFTGWQPDYELTEVSPGVWSAMVPLDPGVHDYTFVIDGSRMVVDPYAPSVADSFGGSNSRLFLPAPNESA
jgi:hypothetical protein